MPISHSRRWPIYLLGLVLCVLAVPVRADERVLLLTLESLREQSPVKLSVRDEPQPRLVERAGKAPAWKLGQGEAVEARSRPAAWRVDLFQRSGDTLDIVCSIEIVYFPAKGRWLPHYRVHDQLILVRDGKGLRPISLAEGLPALVQYHSPRLPNADGFYASLEFGLITGPVSIDAWRTVTATDGGVPGIGAP